MVGGWFVALGLGMKLGGVIADIAAIPKHIQSLSDMNQIYGHAFLIYAMLSLGVAVVCFICVPMLRRMVDDKTADQTFCQQTTEITPLLAKGIFAKSVLN